MKKVSVCGKGGSGKSTIVALLADELCRRGKRVVIVDADESNVELYRTLGFEHPPTPLLQLVGGKARVKLAMRTGVSSGSDDTATSVLSQDTIWLNDIPRDYIVGRNGLYLVAVGKIHQALEGCACPMGVLSREFLKRLQLAEGEFAVVDMEAGIEHFGRGVETSIDAVIAVVEPSLESITLAARISELAAGSGNHFAGVILNKVPDDAIAQRLTAELERRRLPVLGMIRYHQEMMYAGLGGQRPTWENSTKEIAVLGDALLCTLASNDPVWQNVVLQKTGGTSDVSGKRL